MPAWFSKLLRIHRPPERSAELARARSAPVCPSESGATTVPTAEATPNSLVVLLTRHILHDGEIVILILKPSYWFIILQSLRFIAATLIVMIAAQVYREHLAQHTPFYVAWTGSIIIAGRLMAAILQWMARYYVLTDLRIVRLQGIFTVDIFDCALRQVARVRRVTTTRERVLGLGSIEIIPFKEDTPVGVWHTIARPREVHQEIVKAMNRAKQGGRLD